jgi:putative membrane protein
MMMNLSHEVRIFLIGAAMGVANIIPGVSGGTIAVVFGIYEDLMEALGNFLTDREKRWQYIKYLAILFSGSLVAVLSLARILSWSFENYPLPTVYFFLGLIIGSIPVVIKSHSDMKLNFPRSLAFLIGLSGVVVLALLQAKSGEAAGSADLSGLSIMSYIYFAFAGAIAASAMIVPGVSGSFILILLGAYWTVLSAVSELTGSLLSEGLSEAMISRILVLGCLGVGIVLGILVFSKIMSWALKNYPATTMYLILGLIIGSIYQIFPGFELSSHGIIAIVTFVIGIIISLKFGVEK